MLFIWISSTWIQKTLFFKNFFGLFAGYLFRPIPLPSSLSFASLRLRFLPLWALEPFYAQLVNKSHSPAFSTQSSLLNIRQTFNSQILSCSLIQGLWQLFVVHTCDVGCLSLFVCLIVHRDWPVARVLHMTIWRPVSSVVSPRGSYTNHPPSSVNPPQEKMRNQQIELWASSPPLMRILLIAAWLLESLIASWSVEAFLLLQRLSCRPVACHSQLQSSTTSCAEWEEGWTKCRGSQMVTLIFYFPTPPPSSSRLPIGSQRRKVLVHIIQGKAGQGEGNRRIPVRGGGGVAGDTQEICSTLEVVRPSQGNRINYRAVDQQ